jgi:hypothetical protein
VPRSGVGLNELLDRCDAVTENKHEELDFAEMGLVDLPPSVSFFPPVVRKQSRVRVSV